jgi:hypothetical protein
VSTGMRRRVPHDRADEENASRSNRPAAVLGESDIPSLGRGSASWWAVGAVVSLAALLASTGLIGADALWLIPLGREVAGWHLPGSIPWATAPTSGWHDVPALGQLVFYVADRMFGGYRGLLVAQALAAAIGFGALARGLAREAPAGAVVAVSALVLAGSLGAVVVVNDSLYSLALFPVLLALIEAESRRPGRRLWLSVPLIAVWGNLHGEVLTGWALLACYLLLDRARREPWLAAGVFGAATLALLLDPVLVSTPDYYRGVFASAPARRGTGLWEPLQLGGIDLLAIGAGIALLGLALVAFRRIRLWEAVALAGLAFASIDVARSATWFLFVAAYPAARALHFGVRVRAVRTVALVCAVAAVLLLARGPGDPGSERLATLAAKTGKPVLADAVLGQQVALAGGRIWVDNPIDAFRRRDQNLYLDWLDGQSDGSAAVDHAAYVLVSRGSRAASVAARDSRLKAVAASGSAILYRRT